MKVHLLIGTRKGGFIATSDAARREWSLKGPLLKGCEVNHIAHVGNGRLVMAGKSAWWGPALQISDAPGRPGASPARSASGKAAVGVRADFLPDKEPEVGQCVHHMEMHTQQPDILYQQNHCGLYRSDDGGDTWTDISAVLPSRFGFPCAVLPRDGDTVFVIPEEIRRA